MNKATRTARCRGLFVTLSVLGALALTAAPAQAKRPVTVHCGQTLTHSVKLANDLTNCPNNGLVIGADNITLDFNGHVVDGDAVPAGPEELDVGVDNSAGHDGVTIRGGAIQEFEFGLYGSGASHNRVRRVSSSRNLGLGLLLESSPDSRIEKNSFVDNGSSGMLVFDSNSSRIERNSVSGSTGFAIFLIQVDESAIQDNALDGNDHGIAVFAEKLPQHRPKEFGVP